MRLEKTWFTMKDGRKALLVLAYIGMQLVGSHTIVGWNKRQVKVCPKTTHYLLQLKVGKRWYESPQRYVVW